MASADPLQGYVVGDRYRIVGRMGAGGFGAVYEAEHVSLARRFALKVLRRDLELDEAFAKRFEREANLTSSLDHPHIVAVTDFGRDEKLGLYFVMEYLRGEDLLARVERTGPLVQTMAIEFLRQTVDAFVYAHGRGIVHRDVKSANIFLLSDGARRDQVKILDFGIARLQDTDDEHQAGRLTRTGIVMGSASYMAPEQALAMPVDHRTDIYSLGIVLYEALTGLVPFRAPSVLETLNKQIREVPEPPSQVRPESDIHPLVEMVVLRCLQKKPEARYQRTEELARALEEAAEAVAHGRRVTEDVTNTISNLRAEMIRDGALLADSAEHTQRHLAAGLRVTTPTPEQKEAIKAAVAPRERWLWVVLGLMATTLAAGVFAAGAFFGSGRQAIPLKDAPVAAPAVVPAEGANAAEKPVAVPSPPVAAPAPQEVARPEVTAPAGQPDAYSGTYREVSIGSGRVETSETGSPPARTPAVRRSEKPTEKPAVPPGPRPATRPAEKPAAKSVPNSQPAVPPAVQEKGVSPWDGI